jgi:hypothetical protein
LAYRLMQAEEELLHLREKMGKKAPKSALDTTA